MAGGVTTPFLIESGANTNSLVIDSNDRIGIRTASPTEALHVVGSGIFTGDLDVQGILTSPTGTFANSLTISGVPVATGTNSSYPPNYISGFFHYNDSIDTSHDITISGGFCRDIDNTQNITGPVLRKEIDTGGGWVEGDGAGFPSGETLSVDSWYRLFVISKTDGTTDYGWDTHDNADASSLLADATEYTVYRQIAWTFTNGSSNIIGYKQNVANFNYIVWDTFAQDDVGATSTTAETITSKGCPPLGLAETVVMYESQAAGGADAPIFGLVTDLATADRAAELSEFNVMGFINTTDLQGQAQTVVVQTNDNAAGGQYRIRWSSSTGQRRLQNVGYFYNRGRD